MTKKIVAFFVCAMVIFITACSNTAETKLAAIKASIISIMLEYPCTITECVGVAISKDGYILTTAHIFKGEYEYSDISIYCTINESKYAADIICIDRQKDLALIKCSQTLNSVITFSKNESYAGEKIKVATNTLNKGNNVDGVVINNKQIINYATYKRELLSINACLSLGYSGSPLVDRHGNAIGIISAKKITDETTFFAIKSHTIIDFLEDV